MSTITDALLIAIQHHKSGQLPAAEQIYRQILHFDPDHPDANNLFGLLAHQVGQHDLALEHIGRAIRLKSNDPLYYNNLGEVYRVLGRTSEALASFERAIKLNPNYVEAMSNMATALYGRGKLEEAVFQFRRAIKIDRDFAEIHNNLGAVLREQGKIDDAIACHRRALKLKPHYAEAHNNLGTDFVEQGNRDEAIACFRRAIELKPTFAMGHYNLGHELAELGRFEESIACYRRAIELNPQYVEAYYNLGIALNDRGRLEDAVASYRQAIQFRPTYVEAHNNLGNTLKAQGLLSDALNCYRKAFSLAPTATYYSNYLMGLVYDPAVPVDQSYAEHLRWGERFGPSLATWTRHANLPDPHRRLRIGYISADFRKHAVTSFIEPILRHHDHSQYDVICYSNNSVNDEVTDRLKQYPQLWRDVAKIGDDTLANIIREDRVDILIELSGHSAGNRLTMMALKPAPIQITYIGYPATTGLSAIDYRFSDEILNPSNEASHHVEKVYRLPCGSACYVPREGCPEVAELPAIARRYLTFGAPHTLAKMNESNFDLWAKILHTIADSRLVIFRESLMGDVAERVQQQFTHRGIPRERVDVSFQSTATHGYAGYMSKYNEVDVCLDTFPANAGTTCCEALWMGVPWLTLYGDRFFGRQTASVLSRLGLGDWTSQTPDELLQKAVHWNQHRDDLATIRRGLRDRFRNSTLGNAERYTCGLEDAYRDVWKRWCDVQVNATTLR